MDKYIGKVLGGRYEILDIIGVGGMAVVYRARCRLLNRYVAIKILKDEYARDEEFRKRFYIESQAVAKLNHSNIVSVYDVSHDEGVDYIVMELVDGITLKEYLRKRGALPWQEAVYFAQQIAKALFHAHSRGIIHQDIKPQNVLLLRDGTVKVTDFGIAKLEVDQETKVIREAIGSVHYMSPEQAKGGTVDYRTDIYSLGIVLYEMLTGKVPFEGDNALSIVMQHLNAIPLMPSELAPGVPEALDDVVMRAMSPIVSKRYFSAKELYEDLQKIKADPHIQLHAEEEDDEFEQTRPVNHEAVRRAEAKVAAGQAAQRRNNTRPSASRKKKNSNRKVILAVAAFAAIAIVLCLVLIFSGTGGDTVKVPELVGKNYESVIKSSRYEDFDIRPYDEDAEALQELDFAYDENKEEGEILAQYPDAGEKVKKGSVIYVVVNQNGEGLTEDYLVPDFVDHSSREVLAQLIADGVKYTQDLEESEEIESGNVIRTEPAAGQVLKAGEKLLIVISKGQAEEPDEGSEETVDCPNVINLTLEKAKETLEKYGLKVGKVTEVESTGTAGMVLGQGTKSGTKLVKGASVNLEVSVEPKEVTPPADDDPDSGNDNPATDVTKSAQLTPIALPQDGRETCRVIVKLDGKVVYDKVHNTSEGQVVLTVKGTGSQLATIDVDGTISEEIVNFE